jgi:predicted RNA-binding Zn-ribbon protein involved in translation (DUF1610 family)
MDKKIQKNKDMMGVVENEDMRVVERMVELNPWMVRCPTCGEGMVVHHWRRKGNVKVPFFKCWNCGFMG